MKKLYLYFALTLLSTCGIWAQNASKTLHLEKAGTLKEKLSEAEITSLQKIEISGKINEADIHLLRSMATVGALSDIDLSNALFGTNEHPLLSDPEEYFLPMIAGLGKGDEKAMEAYELGLGHEKDSRSLPGFWMFHTNKKLFFMTGYMNGWEGTLDEVVLKTREAALLRSPQIRQWIESLGYKFVRTRLDGDLVFQNEENKLWCLLHFYPFNKSDYPGIHFSVTEYTFE